MGADTDPRIADARAAVRRRKRIGLAFVAVPFALFSIFAIGEAAGLEPGWWAHLLQVAAVVVLAAGAWRWPRIGGPLLIVAGTAASWLLLTGVRDGIGQRLLTTGTFFAPLVAGGVAFTLAGYRGRSDPHHHG